MRMTIFLNNGAEIPVPLQLSTQNADRLASQISGCDMVNAVDLRLASGTTARYRNGQFEGVVEDFRKE